MITDNFNLLLNKFSTDFLNKFHSISFFKSNQITIQGIYSKELFETIISMGYEYKPKRYSLFGTLIHFQKEEEESLKITFWLTNAPEEFQKN
jgi:hypothetical protein